MKKIEAIIKPFKLEEVKDALSELGMKSTRLNSSHVSESRMPSSARKKTQITHIAACTTMLTTQSINTSTHLMY